MNDLLSVIIPVYNSENYLRDTLQSVLNQTYRNIELILVDDGSTDNSLQICKEMGVQDSRIRIISQQNGGVSSARNHGLAEAKGTYIAFVDGDDCLDLMMYETMIRTLQSKQADLVNCRVVKESEYHPIQYAEGDIIVCDNPLECLSKKGHFIDSSLNKVYTRSLIGDTRFDERISYSEDKLFVTELFLKARRIVLLNHAFYHYIQHRDSLSWRDSYDVWDGNFYVNDRIYSWIQKCDRATEEIRNSAYRGYIKSIIALLRYDVKYRKKEHYEEVLNRHQNELREFLRKIPLKFAKKMEYKTYISSYFLASLVHYYFKRKK